MPAALTSRVHEVLASHGPLTGGELQREVGGELFALWKACATDGAVTTSVVGRRYVRLDRTVDGFARLSPSILREFLTYTVVALNGQPDQLDDAARRLQARIKAISRAKLRLAQRIADELTAQAVNDGADPDDFCVLVAGDIVYEMAHDVRRHESSTGGVVQGSDLDLVVLTRDEAPEATVTRLSEAIHRRKWLYLRNPAFQEEVDYVVKRFGRLVEQTQFDTFPHMVACKVFDEARFLAGNEHLHLAGRALLQDRGVLDRLAELRARAIAGRDDRRELLLSIEGDALSALGFRQFYNDDEAAEFEH